MASATPQPAIRPSAAPLPIAAIAPQRAGRRATAISIAATSPISRAVASPLVSASAAAGGLAVIAR